MSRHGVCFLGSSERAGGFLHLVHNLYPSSFCVAPRDQDFLPPHPSAHSLYPSVRLFPGGETL